MISPSLLFTSMVPTLASIKFLEADDASPVAHALGRTNGDRRGVTPRPVEATHALRHGLDVEHLFPGRQVCQARVCQECLTPAPGPCWPS